MFTMKQVEEIDRDGANYKCTVCANAYNSRRAGGGLAFEDLPESWKCPVCDQPKACTKYEDPSEVGGLDESIGRDDDIEKEDSWAECQEQDADDWQEMPDEKFAPRSGGDEERRMAYVGDYESEEFAPKSGGDKNPRAKKSPANGGRLGLMREIRPEATSKGPDNDGRHLGPNGGWSGGWSKPNAPCIR